MVPSTCRDAGAPRHRGSAFAPQPPGSDLMSRAMKVPEFRYVCSVVGCPHAPMPPPGQLFCRREFCPSPNSIENILVHSAATRKTTRSGAVPDIGDAEKLIVLVCPVPVPEVWPPVCAVPTEALDELDCDDCEHMRAIVVRVRGPTAPYPLLPAEPEQICISRHWNLLTAASVRRPK